MRLAIFSDVHANLPALDGVLADNDAVGVPAGRSSRPGRTGIGVTFRRVAYDIERAVLAILASDPSHEFADQLREARGHRSAVPA